MNNLSFPQLVYKYCALIPKGKISTYKEIARALNNPGAARAVGNTLNKNPFAPLVPCHRVIRANGEVGGFASGPKRKIAILRQEGIIIKDNKIDLSKYLYEFNSKKSIKK
ncbi:MAG: MGMT family protein [Patescibacteria group bacterium]